MSLILIGFPRSPDTFVRAARALESGKGEGRAQTTTAAVSRWHLNAANCFAALQASRRRSVQRAAISILRSPISSWQSHWRAGARAATLEYHALIQREASPASSHSRPCLQRWRVYLA